MTLVIRGLLFDFDGVIVSIMARLGWAFYGALKSVKPDIKRERVVEAVHQLTKYLLTPKKVSSFYVPKLIWGVGQICGLNLIELIIFTVRLLVMHEKSKMNVKAELGVEETLVALSKEYKLGLITHAAKKVIEKAFEEIPALKEFDVILTREDYKKTKPNPEGIIKGMKALGLKPEECLYIGDSPHDIIASRRANVKAVGVLGSFGKNGLYGSLINDILKFVHPDYIIPMAKDLPELLGKINGHGKSTDG